MTNKNKILNGDNMLKIELNDYGIEDVLKEISNDLKSAIEKNSKKQKNEIIYKALGKIETLYYVINITEIDNDTEGESDA
jgi:hypothetical protein